MSDKFFMKRRIISVMSLLRRIFFLKGFLEYEILKKAVSVRRCMDSSYLFTPLGASLTQVTRNVIMTSLVSKACQKNGGHFTERTTICEIFEHLCCNQVDKFMIFEWLQSPQASFSTFETVKSSSFILAAKRIE